MSDVKQLIQRLGNFQTRAAARQELVLLGKEAVAPLIAALKHPNEGVRWSAAKTLGEIGDAAAVDALIEVLGNPNLAPTAAESLQAITGKNFGTNFAAWQHWRQTGEDPPPSAGLTPTYAAGEPDEAVSAEGLTDEQVIQRLVQGLPRARAHPIQGGTQIEIPLEGGRRQNLAVTFDSKDAEGRPLVCIYTECGPAHPTKYDTVFRYNLTLPYGSVAVRDVDGHPTFVMMYTTPRQSLDIAVLRRALMAIAKQADALEYELTRKDVI
jgi:hypothetical protein